MVRTHLIFNQCVQSQFAVPWSSNATDHGRNRGCPELGFTTASPWLRLCEVEIRRDFLECLAMPLHSHQKVFLLVWPKVLVEGFLCGDTMQVLRTMKVRCHPTLNIWNTLNIASPDQNLLVGFGETNRIVVCKLTVRNDTHARHLPRRGGA